MCVTNPININGDGLIVLFEASDAEPPTRFCTCDACRT